VVRDQGLLDRISDAAKSHVLATLPDGPQSDRYRTMLSDASFQIFYHASALILISGIAQRPWVAEDCALAAENLMLAAYSEGLGTCWIGFAQGFLNTSEGKNALGLPATWVPVAADHRWPSQGRDSARPSEGAGDPLGWLIVRAAPDAPLPSEDWKRSAGL